MKASWTTGLPEDAKKEVKQEFISAAAFRDRLTEMLRDKMEDQNRHGRGKERYQDPNWPYLQADSCGYNRALADIISLLK